MTDAGTELSQSDIAELAEFFDLLAKYDYEDKIREEGRLDKYYHWCIILHASSLIFNLHLP